MLKSPLNWSSAAEAGRGAWIHLCKQHNVEFHQIWFYGKHIEMLFCIDSHSENTLRPPRCKISGSWQWLLALVFSRTPAGQAAAAKELTDTEQRIIFIKLVGCMGRHQCRWLLNWEGRGARLKKKKSNDPGSLRSIFPKPENLVLILRKPSHLRGKTTALWWPKVVSQLISKQEFRVFTHTVLYALSW